MADFLGSILGTMAGPPKASEKEIAERKKAREMAKKLEERNKQESKVFRQKIEQQIDTFLKGSLDNRNMTFEVMPKVRIASTTALTFPSLLWIDLKISFKMVTQDLPFVLLGSQINCA